MATLELYPSAPSKMLGDNECVTVDAGSEAEATWRGHGYVTKGERDAAKKSTPPLTPTPSAAISAPSHGGAKASDPDAVETGLGAVRFYTETELQSMDASDLRDVYERLYSEAPHHKMGASRLVSEIMAKQGEAAQ